MADFASMAAGLQAAVSLARRITASTESASPSGRTSAHLQRTSSFVFIVCYIVITRHRRPRRQQWDMPIAMLQCSGVFSPPLRQVFVLLQRQTCT